MHKHLIDGSSDIVKALEALNLLSGETMTLFVTDSSGRLSGSLTDGDIRRALLRGYKLTDHVSEICHKDCLYVDADRIDPALLSLARKKGISLLPAVREGVIVSLIDLRIQRGLLPIDAVLMAGGIGERLRPLTEETPKPLLPVGGKPIIDHNIFLLRQFGIQNIYVTVNYLKDQIKAHLKDVVCIEEPVKLGTIGSLSLIDDFRNPDILVMNADLLTDINLEAMYLRHLDTEAAITMAVVPYTVSVPFGIVDHEGDRVKGLVEKPTYNYYANGGIYLLRKEIVREIPKGRYMDATELIGNMIKNRRRVTLYPIEGKWLDIGSPDDYRLAKELGTESLNL